MSMMVFGGGGIPERKDIPVELLMRIVCLLDDRTVIVASGVRSGWRDAICWELTHISLSWCTNHINNLVLALAPKFTKLRVLTLRPKDGFVLDANAVEAIANNCHDLEALDLSMNFKLSDRSLYALARGCPKLTGLNISNYPAFTDRALEFLSSYCRNLKILNLYGHLKVATDNALKAIGSNCRQLESINLGWCKGVGDVGVMSLAYGCPNLHTIDLCGCAFITDKSVIALANNCLHLRSLRLRCCENITDRAMYALAHSRGKNKHEEGLTNLNIGCCMDLTAPAVQVVYDSFPALHTCPAKRSLILSNCWNLTSVHCACASAVTLPDGWMDHVFPDGLFK